MTVTPLGSSSPALPLSQEEGDAYLRCHEMRSLSLLTQFPRQPDLSAAVASKLETLTRCLEILCSFREATSGSAMSILS